MIENRILAAMLSPRTVAVIGASEVLGSVGRALLENLGTVNGTVNPVKPFSRNRGSRKK